MRQHPEPQPEPKTAPGEGCASTSADRKLCQSATGRLIALARPLIVACSCGRLECSGYVTLEPRGGVEGGEAGRSLSEWTRHRPRTMPHSIRRRRCNSMTVEGRDRREVSGVAAALMGTAIRIAVEAPERSVSYIYEQV